MCGSFQNVDGKKTSFQCYSTSSVRSLLVIKTMINQVVQAIHYNQHCFLVLTQVFLQYELHLLTHLYFCARISSLVLSFPTVLWLTISTTLQQPFSVNCNLHVTYSIQQVGTRLSLPDGYRKLITNFRHLAHWDDEPANRK